MNSAASPAGNHGALMDSIYRGQRHIYDATRKYYLFGRDRLIDELDTQPGQSLLEIGCGTGRNLDLIARRWPGLALHGLDISSEMLKSARAKLGDDAALACGDATRFNASALFDRAGFDHVVISFALSMIPDWEVALDQALDALAPGGSLHIVDFGDLAGIPAPLRAALRAWLARFHVSPQLQLMDRATCQAARRQMACTAQRGPLGYYQRVTLTNIAR